MTGLAAVTALALRLGADPDRTGGPVHLRHCGRINLGLPNDAWLAFTAEETLSVTACAYSWRARLGPAHAVVMHDSLDAGQPGQFSVRAFDRLPLPFAPRPQALPRSQRLRYLTELPLAPDAMLHNRALRWEEIDESHLRVATGLGVETVEATFTLDADGRVASVFLPDPRSFPQRRDAAAGWFGRYAEYDRIRGRWIPFHTDVRHRHADRSIGLWVATLVDWQLSGDCVLAPGHAAPRMRPPPTRCKEHPDDVRSRAETAGSSRADPGSRGA